SSDLIGSGLASATPSAQRPLRTSHAMAGGTSMPNGATVIIAARLLAALYDIHGNLPALDAAIAAAEAARVDCFVIGGDARRVRDCLTMHRRMDTCTTSFPSARFDHPSSTART